MQLALWLSLAALGLVLAAQHSVMAADTAEGAITQLKELHIDTVLAAARQPQAAIAVPADGRYAEATAIIQQAIRQASGIELPVIADDAGDPQSLLRNRSLIVLGNMATSNVIHTLYRHWYTWLDLRYPGKNGYAIHSLHNPYGTGHNVLLLGGSDDAGVLRAARRFAEKLEPGEPLVVGWRMDIQLGEDVPTPPEPDGLIHAWSDSFRLDAKGERVGYGPLAFFGWNPMSTQAALYYMTGEDKYLREFLRLAIPDPENLPKVIQNLYVERSATGEYDLTHPIAMAHHYTTHRMPLLWDLIEESPLLTDEQRLRLTNDVRWNSERVVNYGIERSRHGSYVALTAYCVARYFDKYYPAAHWKQLIARAHENFMWWTEHTTWCERDTMEWIASSVHVPLLYFMLTDPTPWVESGRARTMLEALPILWSGRPYDDAIETLAVDMGHAAAWMLGDGRYTHLVRAGNYDMSLFRMGPSWWPTPALEAVPPTDLVGRVSVIPLDEADARDREVRFDAGEGYQFVSFRTGVGPDDGFMRIDGFSGGGRNPHHVAALLTLRSADRDLLNGYGNQLSVLRDGRGENYVPMAARLEAGFAGEGMAYVRSDVPGGAWSTTQRDVLWIDEHLTLVADSVIAHEGGDYEIACQWEPVKTVRPSPADRRWAQSEDERPVTIVAGQPVRLSYAPGPLKFRSVRAGDVSAEVIHDYLLVQTLNAPLAAGERMTLVNAIYADDAPGRFAVRLESLTDVATLVTGARRGVFFAAAGKVGDINIDADTAYLSADCLFVHRGRAVRLGDLTLLAADAPVTLAWNLSQGAISVEALAAVKLTLRLKHDEMKVVNLAAGSHRLTDLVPAFRDKLAAALDGLHAAEAVAAVTQDDRSTVAANWSPQWRSQLPGAARVMQPTPGDAPELWVASGETRNSSGASALHRVGLDGQVRWSFDTGKPVNAIAMSTRAGSPGGLLVVAGGDDNQLRAFDRQGQLLWSAESQVWPEFKSGTRWDAAWFTNPALITGIRSLLIDDLAGTGTPQILVGRPSTVESWALDGQLIARSPSRWGESHRLAMLHRRPHPQLLVGNFYAGRDIVQIIHHDLTPEPLQDLVRSYMEPVPEGATDMRGSFQRGIAELRVVDLDGDGQEEVVVARGGHWNDLRAYNADGSQCLWMHSFGPGAPRVLQELTGRFVRSMSVGEIDGEAEQTVVVGLASGWTHCIAADGRLLWSHRLPGVVTAVAHSGGGVAAGLDTGMVCLIDGGGKVVKTARLDAEVCALAGVEMPRLLIVGTTTGDLFALDPGR